MKQFSPAVIQPITTSITEVTIIRDGFFFNIKQANNKLVRGRSLRKTLYLKQEKETISQKLISEEFCCTYKEGLFNNTMMFFTKIVISTILPQEFKLHKNIHTRKKTTTYQHSITTGAI